jgi:hypothetical protein
MQDYSNDHGGEDDGVVEEVQFHSGHDELDDAGWYRAAEKVAAGEGLDEQQQVLEVVPDLDPESDVPPGSGTAHESWPQHNQSDKHDQCVTIV